MPEINADNAAAAILEKVDEIIAETCAGYDVQDRPMLSYLIRKEVWSLLAKQMGCGADELREEADALEEEALEKEEADDA